MKNKLILKILSYMLAIVLAFSMSFVSDVFAVSNSNVSNGNDDSSGSGEQSAGAGAVDGNISNGDDDGIQGENNFGGPGTISGGISNGSDDTSAPRTPNNPGGGNNRGGGTRTLEISNMFVTPVGSSISTVTLTKGSSYTISYDPGTSVGATILDLVNVANGSNIIIGAKPNTSGNNTINWTVPANALIGNYILRFTDSNNRSINAPDIYKIVALAEIPANDFLGTGGGNLDLNGRTSGDTETSEDLSIAPENPENFSDTQTAATSNAFINFWNKYVLWFFILLLIIAGMLLIQERRNKKL